MSLHCSLPASLLVHQSVTLSGRLRRDSVCLLCAQPMPCYITQQQCMFFYVYGWLLAGWLLACTVGDPVLRRPGLLL
jgi:hypothetical protein